MKGIKAKGILIFFMVWHHAAVAQTKYHFTTYTQEDGLASGTLRSIGIDSTGFLWLLSETGLSRFDGYAFKTFRHNAADANSISSSDVLDMAVHYSGKILFHTVNSICSYNPLSGAFKNLLFFDNKNEVKNFYCDSNGFWIIKPSSFIHINAKDEKITLFRVPDTIPSTSIANENELIGSVWLRKNNLIVNFNPLTKKFAIIPVQYLSADSGKEKDFPVLIFNDDKRVTYFYSRNGLFKFNLMQRAFVQLTESTVTDDKSNPFNGIIQSENHIIIALQYNKIYTVSIATGEEKTFTLGGYPGNRETRIAINGIYQTGNGNFWISTASEGIYLFNPVNGFMEQISHIEKNQNSLPANNIEFMLENKSVLWLVAPGIGLVKAEPVKPAFTSYVPYKETTSRPFELYKNVRAVAEFDKNHLFVGTLDGLSLFNKTTHTFENVYSPFDGKPLFQNSSISKILTDNAKNIWVSSWSRDGILILNYKNKKYVHLNPNEDSKFPEYQTLRCMFLDSRGYLWLGTNADLIYRINTSEVDFSNPEKIQFEKFRGIVTKSDTLIFNITFAISENKNQEILIGTQNGFYKYNYTTNKFKRYINQPGNNSSISDNNVRSFCIDNNEITWIGTNGGGLNRFDEITQTFKSYKKENGLPDNSIYTILNDDSGNLWMGTNRGICRFTIADESCRNYSTKDGIQNNEFNTNAACKLSTGELVFGGISGFNIFHPDSLVISSEIPKIVITQFKVGEEEKTIGNETLNLNYDENYLSFQFAALNFFRNNENKYAYKLEGLDKDWVYCGDRRFTNYANLSPGNYIFRVKAANYYGDWAKEGAALKISISTPWYSTWLFRTLVLLFLSALVYAGFRYQLRQKLKLQDVRNRIASDLHDEIGSTLSSIALYSEVAHKIVKQKAPEVNSLLAQINESTIAMMEALGDIVWTINTRNDRFDNIINRMNAYAIERMEPLNCKVKMETGENIFSTKLNMEQRKNVYLVFKEAVNNAAKYSGCKNLFITLSASNRQFNMKVTDDGKGFDPLSFGDGRGEAGNGLQNMRKRARELNGNISINSTTKDGTNIELKFELKNH